MRVISLQPSLQMNETSKNLEEISKMMTEAASERKPDLVVLPENFPLWGARFGADGDFETVYDFLSGLAREFSVNLIGGSFHMKDSESGILYNRCYIFNRNGENIGTYRKRKLFDREFKHNIQPGSDSTVIDIEGWRISVQICADLWYPELSREIQGDCDILAVPAQSVVRNTDFQEYGRILWHNLAMTRSQENAMVTIVADHPVSKKAPYCSGSSSICDPSMSMLTSDVSKIQLKNDGSSGYLALDLDKERLMRFREYRKQRGMLPLE